MWSGKDSGPRSAQIPSAPDCAADHISLLERTTTVAGLSAPEITELIHQRCDSDGERLRILGLVDPATQALPPAPVLSQFDSDPGRIQALRCEACRPRDDSAALYALTQFDSDSGRLAALRDLRDPPRDLAALMQIFDDDHGRIAAIKFLVDGHPERCHRTRADRVLEEFNTDSGRLTALETLVEAGCYNVLPEQAETRTVAPEQKISRMMATAADDEFAQLRRNLERTAVSHPDSMFSDSRAADAFFDFIGAPPRKEEKILSDAVSYWQEKTKERAAPVAPASAAAQALDFVRFECTRSQRVTWMSPATCILSAGTGKTYVTGDGEAVVVDNLILKDASGQRVHIEDDLVTASSGVLLINNARMPLPFAEPMKVDEEKEKREGRRGVCVACMENIATRMAAPCNHLCLCEACAAKVMAGPAPVCPMCRTSVASFVGVIIS